MGLHQVLLFEATHAAARAATLERVAAELEVEARPLADLLDPARRQFTSDVWRGEAASAGQEALAAEARSVTATGNDLLALAARLRREAADQREGAAALRRQAEQVLRQQKAVAP